MKQMHFDNDAAIQSSEAVGYMMGTYPLLNDAQASFAAAVSRMSVVCQDNPNELSFQLQQSGILGSRGFDGHTRTAVYLRQENQGMNDLVQQEFRDGRSDIDTAVLQSAELLYKQDHDYDPALYRAFSGLVYLVNLRRRVQAIRAEEAAGGEAVIWKPAQALFIKARLELTPDLVAVTDLREVDIRAVTADTSKLISDDQARRRSSAKRFKDHRLL